MPYIIPELRNEMEREVKVENLCSYFSSLTWRHFTGALNYLVTKIVKTKLERETHNYFHFVCCVGTLVLCVFEIVRRYVNPYEDDKIEKNGDV